MFERQWQAATDLGLAVSLLTEEGRVRPAPQSETLVLRSWMMTPGQYTQLLEWDWPMLTSAQHYRECHHLPGWYAKVEDTPETVTCAPEEAAQTMQTLGWPGYFVKDYVKSTGVDGPPIVSNIAQLQPLLEKMRLYRGEIEGGLCLRRVETFVPNSERRYFVIAGRAYGVAGQALDLAQKVAGLVDSPFFSIDVAQREDGVWRVIELGDGQVSDLKEWDPHTFYSLWLKTHFEAHEQPDRWSCADYFLDWQDGVLRYRAEGRDNPKDLWGFDQSYPPLEMDETTLAGIERAFGQAVAGQVRRWVMPESSGW